MTRPRSAPASTACPCSGPIEAAVKVIKTTPADEAIIAIPSATREQLAKIYAILRRAKFARIRIVPRIAQILDGEAHLIQAREIDPEDFLARSPVRVNLRTSLAYVRGMRVLVTGAGGSIGSELCRQLLEGGAERLYLFGHGENSIYEIQRELRLLQEEGVGEKATIVPIIGEIQDRDYLHFILSRTRAHVVFHTAAHKHVPCFSRVLRLSRIVTLPIGWLPMLSKRSVKSTVVAGLGEGRRGHLDQPQLRAARRRRGRIDRHALVVLHLGHRALPLENDLHRLSVRPGDGGRRAAGEEGHFGHFEHALADDRQVLVRLEAVSGSPADREPSDRTSRACLLRKATGGRAAISPLGCTFCLVPATICSVVGVSSFFRQMDAAGALPFFVAHQADHLPHGAEPRTVQVNLVARLDHGAAVERIVVGHGVFHLQAQDLLVPR